MIAEIGPWYVDLRPSHGGKPRAAARVQVVHIYPETLDVIDEDGDRRIVNRMMFETIMSETGPPACPRKPLARMTSRKKR